MNFVSPIQPDGMKVCGSPASAYIENGSCTARAGSGGDEAAGAPVVLSAGFAGVFSAGLSHPIHAKDKARNIAGMKALLVRGFIVILCPVFVVKPGAVSSQSSPQIVRISRSEKPGTKTFLQSKVKLFYKKIHFFLAIFFFAALSHIQTG